MAIFNRKSKHPQDPGMTPFRAGLLAIVLIGVLAFFGFTKANPFSNPYELKATFDTANNLKPRSPVRIAGVDVGKVKKVEPIAKGEGGAVVSMEIRDKGLPIHEDAELKIRQRIFLEGNFFVDIRPGSPSAPIADSGYTVPVSQTAAPVQFGQILTALQSDTREDLQVFLQEFDKGLSGKGAAGFNESIKYWEDAYRDASLANDATLGEEPDQDLQRIVKSQAKVAGALAADEGSLKDLVTNFDVTAGAFAREDAALEATIPALRDTLRTAQPALRSVNEALPSLRAFAREALPGTRSSEPALRLSLPFLRQLRALMRRSELRGLAATLRRYVPDLVDLNDSSIRISREGRALSACTNKTLVPFIRSRIPDTGEPNNTNQQVRHQIQRGFPGLSGESRLSDGNTQWFHASGIAQANQIIPAPPTNVNQPPPRRPDVPCETQEPPNLAAPGATPAQLAEGRPAVSPRTVARDRQFLKRLETRGKRWKKKRKSVQAKLKRKKGARR